MHWLYLLLAGLLEVGWVISLKHTDGFTKVKPIIGYVLFGLGNVYLFSLALKSLPMGLAFSIWMGIAVTGTLIYESFVYNQTFSPFKICCILFILLGIIGLKMTSTS